MTSRIFIYSGLACMIFSQAYIPWKTHRALLGKSPGGIYRESRRGGLPRPPAWSVAFFVLGLGLLVLGCWRAWA